LLVTKGQGYQGWLRGEVTSAVGPGDSPTAKKEDKWRCGGLERRKGPYTRGEWREAEPLYGNHVRMSLRRLLARDNNKVVVGVLAVGDQLRQKGFGKKSSGRGQRLESIWWPHERGCRERKPESKRVKRTRTRGTDGVDGRKTEKKRKLEVIWVQLIKLITHTRGIRKRRC